MKQIQITEDQAKLMFESGIESLKSIAEFNYPELFNKKILWEDFGKIKGTFIGTNCCLYKLGNDKIAEKSLRNVFPTKQEAEACLALSQLCQWRDKYNENWKPNWQDDTSKYTIYFLRNQIDITLTTCIQRILSFKTRQIRNKFLKDFSELILIAKPLL